MAYPRGMKYLVCIGHPLIVSGLHLMKPLSERTIERLGKHVTGDGGLTPSTTGAKAGAGDGVDQNEFVICRPSPSIWRTSVCTWWCIAHFIA